jgi:ABC-2 type transport system ATP-binding protein
LAAAAVGEGVAQGIVVEHVTKSYGGRVVVDSLSFEARPGRVTGFLGPNGSGKSTAMKIMLDLADADQGSVTIDGERYRDLPEPTAVVGALLEANAFHPGRSGRNHLRILADAAGIPHGRVDEVLAQVGLGDAADRRAGAYSLGMRQRLGFAGAMLGDPPVLILDEPANGLDPMGIHEMREVLRSQAAQGCTVLVSSHLLAEVELLADDLVVINRGRLVASGTLAELREEATWVRSPAIDQLSAIVQTAGGVVERLEGGLVVRALAMEEIGQLACDAGLAVHELSSHAGSLEERFFRWTSSPAAGDTGEVLTP